MRNRLTSLILGIALATGCATSPTGRSQLVLMPDSQMDQMGLQAFTNIKEKTPVETASTTNRYVQCVGNAITRVVGGSWEIVVFRDDAANAFALPGRKIGVNTGLLKVPACSRSRKISTSWQQCSATRSHMSWRSIPTSVFPRSMLSSRDWV